MALSSFFDPIVNAPWWQKALLGFIGLGIIVAGSYFLLVSPAETRLNTLRARNASLQKELAEVRVAAADLARTRREVAELEQRLDLMKERLPSEREMPPLFRTITDSAFQVGLGVSLFQPREVKVQDYYVEIPISLTGEGGYHQLGEFFERMAALPRVVTVNELKVTGMPKSGKTPLRAEVTLATYIYRPVGSPPAPKPGAKK